MIKSRNNDILSHYKSKLTKCDMKSQNDDKIETDIKFHYDVS